MRAARVVGLIVGVVAGTGSLAGCEKPPPAVSVFSATQSINEQALCWAFDSDNLQPQQCAQDILAGERTAGLPLVPVTAGNTVGISVDPVVAESGWTPTIAGQRIVETPITETYFRFTVPLGVPAAGVPLQIVAGQDTKIRGVWIFQLQP